MRIQSLVDNYVSRTGLAAEHGFSLYVETHDSRILIDTGQSDIFLANARKLGIALEDVDILVITHGHYDHTGGASAFLTLNKKARVYAKKDLFRKRFHGETKYIGVPEDLWQFRERFTFIDSEQKISEQIYIITDIVENYSDDSHTRSFQVQNGENLVQDAFEDELFVVIEENDRISVLSACSHRGISNITETAVRRFNKPVHLILGGFHLKNEPPATVRQSAERLLAYHPDLIAVAHCTGLNGYQVFRELDPQKTLYFSTGEQLDW